MSTDGMRVLNRGVPQPLDSKRVAIVLIVVMFLPIFNPVAADETVGRDDFGVLEAMADALSKQRNSGEDELAQNSAEAVLDALESRGREIADGDAFFLSLSIPFGSKDVRKRHKLMIENKPSLGFVENMLSGPAE